MTAEALYPYPCISLSLWTCGTGNFLIVGGCPRHCRMLSCIPGLYPQDASHTHHPEGMTTKSVPRHSQITLEWRTKFPWIELPPLKITGRHVNVWVGEWHSYTYQLFPKSRLHPTHPNIHFCLCPLTIVLCERKDVIERDVGENTPCLHPFLQSPSSWVFP